MYEMLKGSLTSIKEKEIKIFLKLIKIKKKKKKEHFYKNLN